MDKIQLFGRAIGKVVGPTSGVYVPLLTANKNGIKSTPSKTFQYGPNDRQYLDVYQSSKPGHDRPIMIFLYGGGFAVGSKIIPQIPEGLVYANLGHFFAQKYGYTVVIPDYRLVQHGAKFPSGAEDLALAVEWVKSNLARQSRNIFLMGNSAGGVHLATYLLDPRFAISRKSITCSTGCMSLRGAILLSAPFDFAQAESDRAETLHAYYAERMTADCPGGLLKAARQQPHGLEILPEVKILVLSGTLDPENEVLAPQERFLREWRQINPAEKQDALNVSVMEGHNHISPTLSLGTDVDREEAWGRQVGDWCNSILASSS